MTAALSTTTPGTAPARLLQGTHRNRGIRNPQLWKLLHATADPAIASLTATAAGTDSALVTALTLRADVPADVLDRIRQHQDVLAWNLLTRLYTAMMTAPRTLEALDAGTFQPIDAGERFGLSATVARQMCAVGCVSDEIAVRRVMSLLMTTISTALAAQPTLARPTAPVVGQQRPARPHRNRTARAVSDRRGNRSRHSCHVAPAAAR